MAEQPQFPSVEERQAFAQKLGEFRDSLPQGEQRMLDAMAMAAFKPQSDVEGYEWFYSGPQYVPSTSSRNPYWYNGSGAAAWNQTPWGSSIGGTQAMFNP
jgi:hypothetical protein